MALIVTYAVSGLTYRFNVFVLSRSKWTQRKIPLQAPPPEWESAGRPVVYPAPIVPKLTIKSTYKIKNLV